MESCVSVRGKVWKDYMERIMNEENEWDHNVEGDAVEGPVVFVCREEVLQASYEIKTGKNPGPSEVSLEMIVASGGLGIQVMAEICQKVLDGFGMPVEWPLSIVVPIFTWKDDISNCSCYGAVKLLEHGMKVVEGMLEKKLRIIEIQFALMPERGTIDSVFILRRMEEEYHAKGIKFYVFCGPGEGF